MKHKPIDIAVLRLLYIWHDGLYGRELATMLKQQGFWFARSRVYSILEKLVKQGLVTEREIPPSYPNKLKRTRHWLSYTGVLVVEERYERLD